MSEYFLAKYRPVVVALLKAHSIAVDDDARDMLAKTIEHNRVLSRDDAPEPHSPVPAAEKALKHARKLLEYAQTPPRRKTSVPTRCASLRAALLSGSALACDLGIRSVGHSLAYGTLLDSLEVHRVDDARLTELVTLLDAVVADKDGWKKVGRPWGLAKPVIRSGCMVWRIAGHARLSYRWVDDGVKLAGALPNFLRELIACCNGTHELIRGMAREQRRCPSARPRGDGMCLSDSALKLAIIECAHDDELQAYLDRRAQKCGTYLT